MSESWGLKEAAAFLRIHPVTLAERARAGLIPGCKVGRSWVFLPAVLEDYVLTRSVPGSQTSAAAITSKSLASRLADRREQQRAAREAASGTPSQQTSIAKLARTLGSAKRKSTGE